MQAEIGAAALVGDREPVAADPHLPSFHYRKANAARADDHDAAVVAAVCADAGDGRIIDIDDKAERMRPRHELFKRALAADPSKAHAGVHSG